MTRLFFYGTLMSDGVRGHVLAGLARPLGPASVRGDLFNVGRGAFPAMLPTDSERRVHGEVWEVFPGSEGAAISRCDMIESYRPDDPARSMYLRQLRTLDDGTDAWMYIWNGRADSLSGRIEDGRWRNGYSRSAELSMEGL